MKKNLLILTGLLFVSLIAMIIYLIVKKPVNSTDTYYVETDKVFSDYQGTKLIRNNFVKKQEGQKLLLDSMLAEIQVRESGVNVAQLNEQQKISFLAKRNAYTRLMTEYQEKNEEEFQQAQQALWIQINQYIKDYGTENKITYILGATGTGNLMYADTSYNITKPIVEYINTRFEGKH
jgi:outer membrane protein